MGEVGVTKSRKLFLQVFQLAHELVIFGIGNDRIIEYVVPVVMEVDFFPEFFDFRLGLRFVHDSNTFATEDTEVSEIKNN